MGSGNPTGSVRCFKMEFDFDPLSIGDFVDVCDKAAGIMRGADEETMRVHRILCNQMAELLSECGADLCDLSDTAGGLAKIFDTLKSASEDLRWWADSVKNEYKYIADEASALGMLVADDCVTISTSSSQDLIQAFEGLRHRAEIQKGNMDRAEYVFFLELDKLRIGTWEKTIGRVFEAFKQNFVPDPTHPWLNSLTYVEGLRSLGASSARAYYMQMYHGKYVAPGDLASRNWFERLTARGNLENWEWQPKGSHAKLPWGLSKVVPILEVGARRAAIVGAVLDGAGAAYDSYQTDTVKHRDWGVGHKIVRAGVAAIGTAGVSFVGGYLGAAAGAAGGAELGGVGVLAGGFVGGVLGSLTGAELGEQAAEAFNEGIVDPVAEAVG